MEIFLIMLFGFVGTLSEEQCGGNSPQQNLGRRWNSDYEWSLANHICCNNHRYAEPAGYFEQQGLFSKLNQNNVTVFYDSVCGKPLFLAPVGRSFKAWYDESKHHGWPSFRPDEMVSENVIIHSEGRMESVCGTHLGHNLPTHNEDRYCIDLVCIAGDPPAGEQFDATTYKSNAAKWSGNYDKTMLYTGIVCASLLAICIIAWVYSRRNYLVQSCCPKRSQKIVDM